MLSSFSGCHRFRSVLGNLRLGISGLHAETSGFVLGMGGFHGETSGLTDN
ncbi:hypothetical protein ABE021_11920 [Sporosarcina gallistercoris]